MNSSACTARAPSTSGRRANGRAGRSATKAVLVPPSTAVGCPRAPVSLRPGSSIPSGFAAAPARNADRKFSVVAQASKPKAVVCPAALATTYTKADPEAVAKYGFEEVRTDYVTEYGSHATLYKHKKTGAELMSLCNDDENKTFGVVLRTPPTNSTGIPHILEHSVLCGSRKYPIKEPFVELMKGSLNTFLNAFTYPDRTCYPVASCNLTDFYNLVDVYLDAVYHPRCIQDEKTFEQEGWHYEMDEKDGEMTFKGVVFNEMKGVYSSPESVLGRECQQALFPDNTYGVDSGGDPAVIPELTFAEFQEFHGKFYHPTNSRLWFYGDDDPNERLRLLDSFLGEFDRRTDIDSVVQQQKLFPEAKSITRPYVAAEGEEKNFFTVNWLLEEEAFDLETELAFSFLDHLMLGTQASPLRKALTESGLGESLTGSGLEDELRQPTFAVGMKGVTKEDVPKLEALIVKTLEDLAETGFDAAAIEASVNSIEFSLRENNTGRFPRGLSLMLRSMSSWLYDRDPFQPMRFTEPLESFKARLASGEDVFGPLIKKYLLNNPHRVTVELTPDQSLSQAMEAEEQAKITAKRASMDDAAVEALVENTRALKEKQETPDDPEALKCIPALDLADIPREAKSIPSVISQEGGATVLRHDLFTNDVLYAEVGLDMTTVPKELLPLLPLFSRSLLGMGTTEESFVDLTQRIGRKTGGLSVSPFTSGKRGSDDVVAYLMLRGKAMGAQSGELFGLMQDVLLKSRLDDKERFKQMVLETRSGMESSVVGSGHSYAASRIDAQRSTAGWVSEQMGGIAYLEYVRELVKRVDSDWEGVQADLEAIRTALLRSKGAIVNLTGDEGTLAAAQGPMDALMGSLPSAAGVKQDWTGRLPMVNEVLTVPTQVNYVGKGANLYEDAGYELSGSSYVINKTLGTSWLWDRVRVSGGAYGGFSDFDSHSGMFTYLSYRDPNLLKTLDNYDGTVDYLRTLEMDQDSLTKAIIGTIGDIDGYQLPDSKGYTALMRHLLDVSDEERQERREQILGTTIKDFREFADVLEACRGDNARVCAVASAEDAAAAAKERPELDLQVKKIL